MAIVVGLFGSRSVAEDAVRALRKDGFAGDEISIIAVDERGKALEPASPGPGTERSRHTVDPTEETSEGDPDEVEQDHPFEFGDGDNVTKGTVIGGAIGGLAGLFATTGSLVVPGLEPFVAFGPISATLAGATAGTFAAWLAGFGLPEETGERFEAALRQGQLLAVVQTSDEKSESAARILRQYGAQDVERHSDGWKIQR